MKYLEPSYEIEMIEAVDIIASSDTTEEINPWTMKKSNAESNMDDILGLR